MTARHRMLTSDSISAHQAAVVCHQYDLPGGYEGSGFTGGLVAVMARADADNLARLAQGYPGYAAAVRLAQSGADGEELLSAVARGQVTTVALRREDICLQVVALLAEAEDRLRTCPALEASPVLPAQSADIAEARSLTAVARSALLRASGQVPGSVGSAVDVLDEVGLVSGLGLAADEQDRQLG